MTNLGDRLGQRLPLWRTAGKRDKRAFTAEMAARLADRGGQQGVSYQSILSYFDGTQTPSVAWVTEAADLLGVRAEWLAFGGGAPTREEEADRVVLDPRRTPDGFADEREKGAMQALLKTLPLQQHLVFEYRGLSAISIKLAVALQANSSAGVQESYQMAGRLLGECIAAPLRILGAHHIPLCEGRFAQAYISAMSHAVEVIAHYARATAKAAPAPRKRPAVTGRP